jgi:hypothetical protein
MQRPFGGTTLKTMSKFYASSNQLTRWCPQGGIPSSKKIRMSQLVGKEKAFANSLVTVGTNIGTWIGLPS